MYCIISISCSFVCIIAFFEKQCIEWQKTKTNNENGMLYLHGQRPVLTGFKSKRKLYYLESSLSTNGGLCYALHTYMHIPMVIGCFLVMSLVWRSLFPLYSMGMYSLQESFNGKWVYNERI